MQSTTQTDASKLIGSSVPDLMSYMACDGGTSFCHKLSVTPPTYDKECELLIRVTATGLNRLDLV